MSKSVDSRLLDAFAMTLQVRDTCLCLHAQRAARKLSRTFDDAFRPLGLTSGQFSLLNALNRPEPARMTAVASVLAMDRTTLTAAVKPLQRRGLVRIASDPNDKRVRLLTLTPAGRALLRHASPIWRETHAAIEALLAGGAPDQLRNDLRALS